MNATATGTSSTGTLASRSAIWSIFAFPAGVAATPDEVDTISLSSTAPILPDTTDTWGGPAPAVHKRKSVPGTPGAA